LKPNIRNRTRTLRRKATTIAFLIVLSLGTLSVFSISPSANAHSPPWSIPSWSFIDVNRYTIGVNQQMFIFFWLQDQPPTATGQYGDRWIFYVDVIKPDHTNETLGPFTSDSDGTAYTTYTPTQLGNYAAVCRFPGQVIAGKPLGPPSASQNLVYVNDTYLPSISDPVSWVVQQNPVQPWTESPLPDHYWTVPVNQASRNWYQLLGNWLSGAAQNVGPTVKFGYGLGPATAHIMWASPDWAGGIMDARYGNIGYETSNYEGNILSPPIILNGYIYYNVGSLPKEGWRCVNLYTGKTVYFQNTTGAATGQSDSSSGSISTGSLAFGQILNIELPTEHGGMPYLWSTSGQGGTWMMYDAFTGNYMLSIANVSSAGTQVYSNDGSILRYNIVNIGNATVPNYRLLCWNTTQAIWWRGTQQMYQNGDYSGFNANDYWMWRPGLNITYDGSHGYSINASIPAVQGSILTVRDGKYVIGGTPGQHDPNGTIMGNMWTLNLDPSKGAIGQLISNITFTPPLEAAIVGAGVNSYRAMRLEWVDPEDGVFVYRQQLTRQLYGFDLQTGKQIWTTNPESQMSFFGLSTADSYNVYNGEIYSYGYGGRVYAYNIKTGELLWIYNATNVGFESPYANYPVGIAAIADGKLYLTSSKHTPDQPLWRGDYLRCINASNGAELWKCLCWPDGIPGVPAAGVFISDGFAVCLNNYDEQLYCFGKGPSATTVHIGTDVISQGGFVLVTGTVTDQSQGAKDMVASGEFSIVPAISDQDQEAWMEYLYEQQIKPTGTTGVPVHVTAIDPNGNFQDLGTATSDDSGFYSLMWTPPVPGKYVVTVSFDGSNSYYGSTARTAFAVEAAAPKPVVTTGPTITAAPSAPPTATVPPATNVPTIAPTPSPVIVPPKSATPTATYIAIGVVVLIAIAAAAALILRKRK